MRRFFFLAALLAFPLLAADTATIHPTAADIAALSSVSAPAISPDGSRIVYVLTTRKLNTEAQPSDDDKTGGWKTERQMYVASPGTAPKQLTFSSDKPSAPHWTPDGKSIAFVRKAKLYVMSLEGGEARPISTGEFEVSNFDYSPDGKWIAFTASVPLTDAEKKAKWSSGGAESVGEEWRPDQLYIVAADGGKPRRVTTGTENVSAFEWSPDGTRFLVAVAQSSDPYYVSSLQKPEVISATDGAVVKVLDETPKTIASMHWSPDGKWVAWAKGEGTLSLLNQLAVRCVATSGCPDDQTRNAAKKIDPMLGDFLWSADSKSIVAQVDEKISSVFYRLPIDGATATPLAFRDKSLRSTISRDRAGRFAAFNAATPTEPTNPMIMDTQNGDTKVVLRVNPQIDNWSLGRPEIVHWKSPEGMELEGMLLVPKDAKPGIPTPLMVLPHGGPDAVTQNSFSGWANYMAAHGYAVFQPNYRGSTSYGFALYAANRGRLGEIEFMDIESGVDALIAAKKADPKQLFYGGWSWGGYLTAWTIGHTNRYRAATVGAGIIDTGLQYVLSDINHGVAAQWEFKGNPWLQPENFARSNPLLSLAKVKTPTLIIHGQADDRVPLPNGLILYRALSDIGTEVKLLTYPDEPHGFTNPAHNAHMLGEWLAWYDKHR